MHRNPDIFGSARKPMRQKWFQFPQLNTVIIFPKVCFPSNLKKFSFPLFVIEGELFTTFPIVPDLSCWPGGPFTPLEMKFPSI